MECSSAQGYFSSKYSSYWIEVESPLTIQVYLSSNSIISPLIATVAEETEILQRWQTDDGGQKGEGQEKLQELNMQAKHVYTGRGNCHHQAGRKQINKTEGRQTEELRAEKNDAMNHVTGKTLGQHLGKYWEYILNRKLSVCDWEKR